MLSTETTVRNTFVGRSTMWAHMNVQAKVQVPCNLENIVTDPCNVQSSVSFSILVLSLMLVGPAKLISPSTHGSWPTD